MRSIFVSTLIGIALMSSAMAPHAIADGGRLQLSHVVDGRRYTAFTSPTPLQPGIADISLLIQDVAQGHVIGEETLHVTCRHRQSDRVVEGRASHADSTNRLLQSAKLMLPDTGAWQIEIVDLAAESPTEPVASFAVMVEVQRFSIPWTAALVTAPLWFIAIFLLRERIRFRK